MALPLANTKVAMHLCPARPNGLLIKRVSEALKVARSNHAPLISKCCLKVP